MRLEVKNITNYPKTFNNSNFYIINYANSGMTASVAFRTPGSKTNISIPSGQALVLFGVKPYSTTDEDLIVNGIPSRNLVTFPSNGLNYKLVTPIHQNNLSAAAVVCAVQTLQENDYASICKKYSAEKDRYNFILAIDRQGHYCYVSNNTLNENINNLSQIKNFNLVKIHQETNYDIVSSLPESNATLVEYSRSLTGFFYGDAFFNRGSRVKENFFLYNKQTFQSVISPTSVNRVLSRYNDDSNQQKIEIVKCTSSKSSTLGTYYDIKDISDLQTLNGESDAEDLQEQYSASVIEDYLNRGSAIDFGYVAPTGTSNVPQNYITDLNAYQLKFVRGIDSRSDRLLDNPFTSESNTYKVNMIQNRNTLYIGIDYRSDSEKSDKESLSQLADLDVYGDLQTFGAALDTLDNAKAPYILKIIDNNNNEITLQDYFSKTVDQQKLYKFKYFKRDGNNLVYLNDFTSFKDFIELNNEYWKNSSYKTFEVDFKTNTKTRNSLNLESLELVEAFTRGRDFLQHSYSTVRPQEQDSDGNKLIDFEDNYFIYKYSGRGFGLNDSIALVHEKDLLLENDVTLGETYGRQTYFIEAIKYKKDNVNTYLDTFLVKNFLDEIGNTKYTEDDYEIIEGKIELNNCEYYKPDKATYENAWCDCNFGGSLDKECYYQKCGVCPYRFTAEKHPRRIRTLEQSKSNRFNLIQELSKVFEIYPQFLIEYDANGRIKLDEEGHMKKHIAYMTEKGSVNYAGFRYEKNLSGINRSVDSQTITTKLYVEPIDSELAKNGICSIQTAPDNIGKNSYVLDLSYYTKKGLLNKEQTQRDIWGIDSTDLAFLPTIGKYNQEYDDLATLIILNNKQLTDLEAKVTTSVTGVTTALEERKKNSQKLYQFKAAQYDRQSGSNITINYTISDTYTSYLEKYREQATILFGLVETLFFSGNKFIYIDKSYNKILLDLGKTYSQTNYPYNFLSDTNKEKYCKGELWWKLEVENEESPFANWPEFKELILDKKLYTSTGLMGQYTGFYNQNQIYKKQQQAVLNKINEISKQFHKIYEPYIKEGTWTDSNYLTDNEYYWAANEVLHNSSKPQVSYDINVIDISPIEEFEEDYEFDIGDTTYVEDIDFFDINPITGLPNREKVIISEITYSLDLPNENSIKTQNYTTQFEDLFENITATVQSLTYNENTYKRASNFTAQQYVQTDSLQGTLDEGNLTLLNAHDKNIVLDESGTEGSGIDNKASKYKLSGEGLFFSTDGGQTWDIGVGPKGWNLDYAKFGQLDVSRVQIIDGKYIYFLWDKNGINAYRNPATSTNGLQDFARFNKYGLSLVEKGHVRLRAGYEFKNNLYGNNFNGDYADELSLTNQNIGFYLYNDKGQPIFKTETASEYNDKTTDYSARLSLKGEMFITNTNLSDSKIATGQSIASGKTLKLSGGYSFMNTLGYMAKNSVYTTNYVSYIVDNSGTARNTIVIEPNSTYNGVVYKMDSDTAKTSVDMMEIIDDSLVPISSYIERTILLWSGTLTNTTNSSITVTLNAATYQKILDNDITGLNITGASQNPIIVQLNTTKTKILNPKSIKILRHYDSRANFTFDTTGAQVNEVLVEYYENQAKVSKKLVSCKATHEDSIYYYWNKKEEIEIETAASNIATKDVGIFINNKLATETGQEVIEDDQGGTRTAQIATSGNERVFMIALKGKENNKTVFRNVISALKNGVMYVGGEVQSELGTSLGDINFNTLPDKVRITNASMIVANNGYIWADWSKFFNIKNGQLMTEEGSLEDYFKAISSAFERASSKETSSDISVEGYYVIDPVTEVN